MYRLALGGYRTGNITSLLLALIAVGLGISIAYQPLFTAIALIGIAVISLAVLSPQRVSYLLLVSSAISVQYLYEGQVMGMDLLSLHKLGILVLSLPAAFRYGVYGKYAMPVAALAAMLGFTYFLADTPPLLGAIEPIKAFIGLASPFVLLLIRWPKKTAAMIVKILCFLPLVSVLVGLALESAGIGSLFVQEFNGSTRLEGANIPPHLAFLAFMAFMVSTIEAKRRPDRLAFYYAMMSVNFLIILLTGTRGALISLMLMVFIFMYDLTKQFLKGKTALIIPLLGFVAVLVSSVWLQLDNLEKRSFERSTEAGIDLSGRLEAWDFFLKGVEGSPWFGKGLGAVLVANDGSIYEGFNVPHNEYIRFYYDGGIVGAVLLFAAIFYVFRNVIRETAKELRIFMIALIIGFLIYSISDNTLSTLQFILPFCIYLNASGALSWTDKEKPA
ncbi:MAG: O-antigen ligase family protein [Cohnella sp.]|nr:O-antigen ligase family protein [Cohnella sp.]